MNIEYVKSVEEPRHKTRCVFVTHEIMAAISLLQVCHPDPELANLTNYNLAVILTVFRIREKNITDPDQDPT